MAAGNCFAFNNFAIGLPFALSLPATDVRFVA